MLITLLGSLLGFTSSFIPNLLSFNMENLKNIPLNERMKAKGLFVTSKKWGSWDNCNRMIIDIEGKEIDFMTPSECFKMIKKLEE